MSDIFSVENCVRKYPFKDMKISDNSFLNGIEGRSSCIKCGKSRKFFCYTCYLPVNEICNKIPKVNLPIKIDIIKHKNEIDGKSSAAHASILAPNDVKIYSYPDIPNYHKEDGVILIFPGTNSITIKQLFNKNIKVIKKENFGLPKGFNMGTLLRVRVEEETLSNDEDEKCNFKNYTLDNLPIKKAVFIDSTWNQSRGIYKDERICNVKSVILQNRISQFWRHQRGSPRWYLATIEAIHQFLLELHVNAWGLNSNYRGLDNLDICEKFYENLDVLNFDDNDGDLNLMAPYNGQYDNLLFFFSYMYNLIHLYYDHNELKSYKRPF